MPEELSSAERLALTHLNVRRFELLLCAAKLHDDFTAQELRAVAAEQSSTSLTRDLNALEAGGLLIATPPASEQRQGRPVYFRIAPNVVDTLLLLAERLSDASTQR